MRLVITGVGKFYVMRSKIFNRLRQSSVPWSSKLKLNDKKEAKCFTQKVNALVKSMWLKATNKVRFWKAKVKPSKSHKRRALLLKP
jgi:hypothetical protein